MPTTRPLFCVWRAAPVAHRGLDGNEVGRTARLHILKNRNQRQAQTPQFARIITAKALTVAFTVSCIQKKMNEYRPFLPISISIFVYILKLLSI